MRKMIIWLFHILFLFVPLFFSIKTDELFEFNKMILTYAITSGIVALWIARMTKEKRFVFQRTPLDIPLALFLISAICSTVFSIHPYTSWFGYYSRFNGGLLSLLTYSMLFYAWVSNVKKEETFGLLHTLIYGALLSTLYSIPEHFGHSPSCLFITGNFDVSCWVQDVQTRVFGTFGQPNWLAAYLILPTLLAVASAYSVHVVKKTWMTWGFICIALMFFANLLFTGSRSGFLGIGISLGLFFIALFLFGKTQKKTIFSMRIILVFILGSLALYLSFDAPFKQQIVSRAEFLFQRSSLSTPTPTNASSTPQTPIAGTQLENGGTESGAIRAIVWKGAIAVWRRYPLFGSGLETFAYSYYRDRPMEHNLVSEWDFLYNKAHNELLNVLATSGLFGLLTYLLFFGWIFVWVVRVLLSKIHTQNEINSQKDIYFSLAILSSLVGIHLTNFLGFSTVVINIFLFLGSAIVITLLNEHVRASPQPEITNSMFDSFQWIGYVIAVVILCVGLGETLRIWRADASYTLGKQLLDMGESQLGLEKLETAISLSPNEALFHDELSSNLASFAVSAAEIKEATLSAQLTQLALHEMQTTSMLNPVHLNFFRSQARSFIALSALDSKYLDEAIHVLEKARTLAPTDAKLVYNLGVIAEQQSQILQAIGLYTEALRMKPNYDQAKERLVLLQQAATTSAQQTKGAK